MRSDYRDISNDDIKRFIPYVRGHIGKKHLMFGEKDELFSAGLEGIAEGLRRFEPEKGVPRDYWVQRYAAHYIQNRFAQLSRPAAPALEKSDRPLDAVAAPSSDPLGELENAEQVALALRALDADETRVIDALYRKGDSLRAAARRLGLKVDAVFRLHRRALGKMRRALGVETE